MANTETAKQERMHIRLDTLSKQKLERAAAYAHKSLSEFVLSQALHAADDVIQEHECCLAAKFEPPLAVPCIKKWPISCSPDLCKKAYLSFA
jgi:hypothetical protein